MSVRRGVATVVSKTETETMTIVTIVRICAPLSTGAINRALEAETNGGGPGWGETTRADQGVAVGQEAVAVVAVVGVGVSLWCTKCKRRQAGDDLEGIAFKNETNTHKSNFKNNQSVSL